MATYTLIESYSTDDSTVLVQARTQPVPSLVEDGDGMRMLLLAPKTTSIPLRIWQQAHAAGAAALVVVQNDGLYSTMTAEAFIDLRRDNMRAQIYDVPNGWLTEASPQHPPQYRDLILVQEHQERPERKGTFVHVHTHTEFSQLDGLSTMAEAVTKIVKDGQTALAITDHGTCAAHPDLQVACDEATAAGTPIKPVFGMEAYLVPDRTRRTQFWFEDEYGTRVDPTKADDATKKRLVKKSDSKEALGEYTHICLWAMDQDGLRNLWAMSTEGHREGFYGKPRIDWDTLTRLNKGVLASTGCLRGPVSRPLLDGDTSKATENLGRLVSIFGDRLYVEIHTNQLNEQIRVNHALVQMAQQMSLPMIAAVDSHYACEEDKDTHRAWLAMQTNKDLSEDTSLFAGGHDYHLATEAEVRTALNYLDLEVVEQAVRNTVVLADRCSARVEGAVTTPTFSKPSTEHPDPVHRDMERLLERCLANWQRKVIGKTKSEVEYSERFEREMRLLIDKQFCGYFLLVADYAGWAKSRGCLVGPGRGSGGGSLVAYLADIVEIDPVDADLIFERFLTEGRTSLPDFDIDFPASWRERLKGYLRERWGDDYVVTIGTVGRLQSKGAFNDSARVLKPVLPYEVSYLDGQRLKKAIDAADAPLAGKHMPWEDFCVEFSDEVEPLRAKYPEVFSLTDRVIGRVKSYGKHPAGVVVSTDRSLTDLPMRVDKDGNLVTQFDMVALERLGYVKFDLLTLRTLDTIQICLDLVRERFNIDVDVYSWKEEYEDPQVWDQISAGRTLGLFQIETRAGTRLTRQYKPQSLHDLAAVMTLVRPGPKRSGLTDTYLRRRAGLEPVSFFDPLLEQSLGDTYGTMIYQEQVMQTCMLIAGYDSNEADSVRKILGKKQVEKVASAGQEFISRSVENGFDRAAVTALWEQMAEFAKYGFGKAHAFGYATLGYWCVAGPTRLYDWDKKKYVTIAKAYREGIQHISCYDEVTGKTIPGKVAEVVCTGKKMGYVLRLKSNKRLEASEMHLILTDSGWKRMKDVQPGDKVASERRVTVMSSERRKKIADGMAAYWASVPEDEVARRVQALNDGQDFAFRSDRAKARWEQMDQVERQDRIAALIDSSVGGTWGSRRRETSTECGHKYSSLNEREVCHWFNARGIEHEAQVYINGRPADFRCQGVFIEFDGIGREESYFEQKFGDEPYLVIRDRNQLDLDLGFLLEEDLLRAGGVVTFEPVVSITPTREVVMYDVMMENDPHNFLADGVVVHNTAWFKFHFPIQFLTAALSSVDDDRIPEFITEGKRMGFGILPPDVNESQIAFSPGQQSVRYGLASIKGIGEPTARQIVSGAPYSSLSDFVTRQVEPTGSKVNKGHLATLVAVGAFDSITPNRRAAEMQLEAESSGAAKTCVFMDRNVLGPGGLPCRFDWVNEPDAPMIKKGRGKEQTMEPKPPPKRCTAACRQYSKPEPVSVDLVLPYTEEDIRNKEKELLGVWLSSTPFDRLDPAMLEAVATADEVESGPEGIYYVAAIVEAVKIKQDRNKNNYAWVTLNAQDGSLDAICFSDQFAKYYSDLTQDSLIAAKIAKNDRGVQLLALAPATL